MKVTLWHDGDVKPVHEGVYECYFSLLKEVFFSYWDGFTWHSGWITVGRAYENTDYPPSDSKTITKWRGLAVKP